MGRLKTIREQRQRRSKRVKSTVRNRLRLIVTISNKNVTAQIVDIDKQKTLASSTTIGRKMKNTLTEKAAWVGEDIAKKASKAKIKKVSLVRGYKAYHGRVKALAEAARKAGLEF